MKTRMKFIEVIVAGSIIATLVVMALPQNVMDRFDRNPDNTLPIESILPSGFKTNPTSGPIQIVLVARIMENDRDEIATYVLMNTGQTDQYYSGYTPTSYSPRIREGRISPLYRKDVRSQNAWEERKMGWCGNGATRMRLKPGHAGRFSTYRQPDQPAIRIGVYCSATKTDPLTEASLVWAEPLEDETTKSR